MREFSLLFLINLLEIKYCHEEFYKLEFNIGRILFSQHRNILISLIYFYSWLMLIFKFLDWGSIKKIIPMSNLQWYLNVDSSNRADYHVIFTIISSIEVFKIRFLNIKALFCDSFCKSFLSLKLYLCFHYINWFKWWNLDLV